MTKRVKWFLILCVILLGAGSMMLYGAFHSPNYFLEGSEKMFYVSKGQAFASVVDSLETAGIIRNRASFIFVARLHGGTTRVQIGKYNFGTGISNYDLLLSLTEGKGISLISVTLPEGLRSRQQAHILARTIGIDSARFVALAGDESFTHSLGITARTLEGYLFPETYNFYWQADERDILTRQVRQFQMLYNDSLQARARELGWTMNQVMTMASIVEGEAVLPEERPIISGVYRNRLRKGMKLEADPTIRFALEDGARRILYSDLQVDNPYNTYRNRGLPPGPINNPGRASIFAALYPSHHSYLFFVANGKGGHWFSSTYAEHMRYVRQYRRERRLREARPITGFAGKSGVR